MHERRWIGSAAIVAAAMLGFALWQHVMPPGFVSVLGLNPAAAAELHAALRVHPPIPPAATFTVVFRALLVVAFAGYGALLSLALRCPPAEGARRIARASLALPILIALLMPASFSTDVYTYVGYARMAVMYGLNPHVDAASELVRLGDPTAPFIHWKAPSPYGPLATLSIMAVVAVVPGGSMLAAVMVIKLLTAAALVGAAIVASRIVREFDPARADAALIATALNPLLLIEGPGNAHNDVIAAAFVLLAFLALLRRRPHLAALAVGAGAAIKLIPLLLLPWVAFVASWPGPDDARAGAPSRALARVKAAAVALIVGILPLVVLYAPFWRGGRTFATLAARWQVGHADAAGTPPAYLWIVIGLYLLGSAWLLRARRAGAGAAAGAATMMSAWALLTMPLLPLATDKWFPWYLAWAWSAALVRWDRANAALFVWLLPISFVLTLLYSVG